MATKIANNIPYPTYTAFKDVEEGGFFLNEENVLCMRVGAPHDSENAFYFEGDMFITMGANEMVTPVNVTINIDNYGK